MGLFKKLFTGKFGPSSKTRKTARAIAAQSKIDADRTRELREMFFGYASPYRDAAMKLLPEVTAGYKAGEISPEARAAYKALFDQTMTEGSKNLMGTLGQYGLEDSTRSAESLGELTEGGRVNYLTGLLQERDYQNDLARQMWGDKRGLLGDLSNAEMQRLGLGSNMGAQLGEFTDQYAKRSADVAALEQATRDRKWQYLKWHSDMMNQSMQGAQQGFQAPGTPWRAIAGGIAGGAQGYAGGGQWSGMYPEGSQKGIFSGGGGGGG